MEDLLDDLIERMDMVYKYIVYGVNYDDTDETWISAKSLFLKPDGVPKPAGDLLSKTPPQKSAGFITVGAPFPRKAVATPESMVEPSKLFVIWRVTQGSFEKKVL